MITDERQLEEGLRVLLTGDDLEAGDELLDAMREVQSYEDAGVLTTNRGLVVRLANGAEFQLTIVQSARAGEGR